jgi:coenzyme F420-reducing hydrogenase delta subunit/Pyruvate/2-oxoacid:ferredoxin oxidoreductase delta subunit
MFVRGRATAAVVDPPKCDECLKCVQDCPYGAISMVPRNDPNSKRPTVALVDPSLCVGCGICTGSCDSSGIGLDWLPAPSVRLETDAWLAEQSGSEVVVYICEPSRTPDLSWDSESGRCAEIPGCRFIEVPCSGWVHPLTVERALRKGAAAALIVGCPDGACPHREGGRTTEERMEGKREPALRLEKVDGTQVWVLREPWADGRRIAQVVQALRRNERPAPRRLPPQAAALLGVAAAVGLVIAGSLVPYRTPYAADPEFVISVKHPGTRSEVCQERTQEELDRLPAHMRTATVCDRERAPVTVRVFIDGELVEAATFEAPGLSSDGIATGVVRSRPGEGEHLVRVEVSDTADAGTVYEDEQRLTLERHQRVVLAFERGLFEWHGIE